MLRPHQNTLGLAAILAAMLYAGISQNNAAAFLLAFLLCGLTGVSVLHAFSNLHGLQVTVEPIAPPFEGEPLILPLTLSSGRRHLALTLTAPGALQPLALAGVSPGQPVQAELLLASEKRGQFESILVYVESTYPLGFFSVRRRFLLRQRHHVYPRSEGEIPLPAICAETAPAALSAATLLGGEDFAGTREWRTGESMRHVDWKAVARGQRLMVKQWSGGERPHYEFAFVSPELAHLSLEPRLRQLTRWIIEAERRSAAYSLHLPTSRLPLGHGEPHLHAALRHLSETTFPPSTPPAAAS